MKKLLLFCTLFITLCSIGQTINISTGLASVGQTDANWKFGATTPGTNTPYIVSGLSGWQSTPVSVTNAKWISPHMDGGLGQIDYIYDFDFTVQPNRNRLDYNFYIAADDVLKSIELLNGNVAVQNIPFPVNSNDRFFSKQLTGSINCPKEGNYKLRIKVFCHDAATENHATGLLISGKITLTDGSCCECGNWKEIEYKLSDRTSINTERTDKLTSKTLKCGSTIVVKKGTTLGLNPLFSCTVANCNATYSATLVSPSGAVQKITTFPYSFNQTTVGYYTLKITPTCNGRTCQSCNIKIFVTPGCSGDILDSDKKESEIIDNASPRDGRG